MVEYKCLRCGYIGKQKIHLINHLKRKNICVPKLDDISIEEINKFYGFEKNYKSLQITPNHSKITPNHSKMTSCDSLQNNSKSLQNISESLQNNSKSLHFEHNKIICEYCLRTYTRKDNLTKHLKICKKKKEAEILSMTQNNEIKELKGMVEKLLIEKSQYSNPTVNNTDNSTTINVISLNNYGSEDTQYITKEYLMGLLEKPFKSIPELIKYTHFNKEHPENQNIKLPNKKEPYVKILKDNKWQLVDRKDTINDLIDQKHSILNNIDIKSKFKGTVKDRIETFNDKYLNDDKELVNKLYKDSELVLINNS